MVARKLANRGSREQSCAKANRQGQSTIHYGVQLRRNSLTGSAPDLNGKPHGYDIVSNSNV